MCPLHRYTLTFRKSYSRCVVAVSYEMWVICNSAKLTFGLSYENVRWNEFDSFAKPRPWLAPRTHPQPDLTYAFPIQTSTPVSLEGFARDELTQTLSVQSLGKLVEQGVACAPTTALANRANLPDRLGWSSSDRSCFPWAVVEIKKDVTSPRDVAIERCYCQAANAAAAALEIQVQLFEKFNDTLPLQSPPVVAFTCVGPVVKVWLAYNDKTVFGHPVQVRAPLPHLFVKANLEKRMRCIWSTSMRLTWGVVSLRAIIKNMHTWSSRLLKPKLQVAILQASKCLPTKSPPGLHSPLSWCLPFPAVDCPEAASTNSSSRENPIIAQMFGKQMTPEKHSTPASHPRIDTPTPSRNADYASPLYTSRSREALGARKDPISGTLFTQLISTGTDIFSRPGIGSSIGTATGVGLRNHSTIKGVGLFGGTSTSVARESEQDMSTSETSIDRAKVSLFGPSQTAASPSSNTVNTKEGSTSGSPTKLATNSLGTTDPSDKSSTCRSSPEPGFGPPCRPMVRPSWKPESDNKDNVDKSSVSGSSSKQTSSPSGKPGFENNHNMGKSSTLGLSPQPTSACPPDPLPSLSNKRNHGDVGTSSDNHGGGLVGASSSSDSRALGDVGESTCSASVKGTDMFDITTAFESTSLEDVFHYESKLGVGTTGTPFSAHREREGYKTQVQEYQTITFQPPYENYSLEELRMADYDRGRRYPLPGYGFYRSISESVTQDDHSDEDAENDSDEDFDQDASDDSSDESSDDTNEDSTENLTESPIASSTDDSNADYSSDSSSGRSTHGALAIHGLRLVSLKKVKRMISDLEKRQQRRVLRTCKVFINSDGTMSIPLRVVVEEINKFLEPADRIT